MPTPPLLALPVSLSLSASPLWLLPALVLALLLARWAYPGGEGPVSPGMRRWLRGLRAAAWLLVFLIALAPILRWPEALGGRFRVVWLTDRSLSMELPAAAGGSGQIHSAPAGRAGGSAPSGGAVTRAREAQSVRAAVERMLGSRYDFTERSFARTLADSAGPSGPGFRGSTALGDALAAAGGLAGGRPAAVVVVSDGVTTLGQEAWTGAEQLGLPVFPVLAADSSAAPDAALSEVAANSTAYVKRPTPLLVTVASRGLAGRSTTLELSENGRPLARAALKLPRAGETEIPLTITPETPGVHFYDVRLAPVPGELTELNNRRVVALEVLADKARVVVIQGAPGYDFSFLRRSLEEEPDLAPEFWIAGPGGGYMQPGAGGATTSPAGLAARLQGASILVLGDLEGAPGPGSLLQAVAARMRAGAGLWVYGGTRRDGLGAYRGTPVGPLLPFDVEAPPGASLTLSPEPAPEARNDPIFGENGLDEGQLRRWSDLPPAAGVRTLPVRGGARRLLSAVHGPGSITLGAAWQLPSGGGHVFALNSGQIYRWTFTAQGVPGGNDVFPAFLSRLWRWLNEPAAGEALAVRPARRVVGLGEDLAADVTGQRPGEKVTLEAVPEHGPGITMHLSGTADGRSLHAEESLGPGRYSLVAHAYRSGRETGRAQTEAAVEPTGPEWIESAPDAGALERSARASGGHFFASADTAALARALASEARRPRGNRELALQREPWPYALALLCFGTEWWLRRRRGLP